MGDDIGLIRNRGIAVSAVLFIWSELIRQIGNFLDELLKALKVQVEKAKRMEIDPQYRELLNLQTSLTQGEVSSGWRRNKKLNDSDKKACETK